MFNAIKRFFKPNKARVNAKLQRGMLAADKRCLAAWRGILPQTGKRYSLVARHLRRLPGEERAPFKAFPEATHDFSIWYARLDRETVNEFLLFHEQHDLGHERIAPYLESELAQWRSPDGYNAARRLIDNTAIAIGEKLAKVLTLAPPHYLIRNSKIDRYYVLAIEDAVLDFEHLRRKIIDPTPLEDDFAISLGFLDGTSMEDVAAIASYRAGDRVLIVGARDKLILANFRQLNPHVNADGLIGRWGTLVDIAKSSNIASVRVGGAGNEVLIQVPKVLLRPFGKAG